MTDCCYPSCPSCFPVEPTCMLHGSLVSFCCFAHVCSIAWAPAAEHERNHCSILRLSSVLERKAPCGHAQTCLAKYVWFKGFSIFFSLKQALCLLSKRTLALRRLTHLLAHNSACGTTWSMSAAFDKSLPGHGCTTLQVVPLTRSGLQMLSMAHVFHVWWLHGLTYKPMDAVLFLDIRSLVFSIHGKIRCAMCMLSM